MAEEVLRHMRLVAAGETVATVPALLEVRGRDREPLPVPLSRREPLPGVGGIFRRMRPAVHPDGAFRRLPAKPRVDGDELLGSAVVLVPDAHLAWSAVGVVRRVGFALVFGQREQGRAPAQASESPGLVDRDAVELDEIGSGETFRLILVVAGRPFPGEIELRVRRCARQSRDHQHGRHSGQVTHRLCSCLCFLDILVCRATTRKVPLTSRASFVIGTEIDASRYRGDMEQPAAFRTPSIGTSGLLFYRGDQFPNRSTRTGRRIAGRSRQGWRLSL